MSHYIFLVPKCVLELKSFLDSTSQHPLPFYNFIYFLITFNLLFCKVIINSFADNPLKCNNTVKPNPEQHSSFLNRMFYIWYDSLVMKGRNSPIQSNDIWDLKLEDNGRIIAQSFDYHLHRYQRQISGEILKVLLL